MSLQYSLLIIWENIYFYFFSCICKLKNVDGLLTDKKKMTVRKAVVGLTFAVF